MKYMGSKARISKDISKIINDIILEKEIHIYIEPFVGGCNMIEHINCLTKIGIDNNEYLISMWNSLKDGWIPPNEITKELYDDIKNNKEKYEKSLVSIVGFCATYNAKWFGGYAGIVHTKANTIRNYYDESVRNILKQVPKIKNVNFKCGDYKKIKSTISNCLIYCDPPYEGTTKYKDEFNHEEFWQWVRNMSQNNIVLVSEYNAPADFECIWSKELTTTLDKNSRKKDIEKLFKLK